MSLKPWVGVSESHRRLLELIERVARLDVELLFCGETGVGKEHYARYAHEASARSSGPFVSVNCGSIPTDLFENELFGHVGGAFTGARARSAGLVEAAEGGTLFFDEVDSLASTNQVKLLRLLQEKEYRRLGDARAHQANARVLAATNRDLVRAVRAGQFREDLLFRLRVVPVTVPPLRERRDDILPLLDAFRDWYAREYGLEPILFTPEARVVLRGYRWPGNIRELENLVRNLTCVGPGRVIEASQLPLLGELAGDLRLASALPIGGPAGALPIGGPAGALPTGGPAGALPTGGPAGALPTGGPAGVLPTGTLKQAKTTLIAEFERKYLEEQLAATGGNIAKAARAAGKPRRAFFELMRKYGISSSDR